MSAKPDPRSLPVAVLLTALVAYGPISTDVYLPSLPSMTEAFGTTVSMVQLTLSVFIAGFAFGMLIYGPLSDRLGRRPVLIGGAVLYLVASIACLFSQSIEALIAARFVQAVGACAGPVVARAVVRDIYRRDEAARMLSYMASAMALAPAVGPMLGGWLHQTFGWQANFVVLALFGLMVLVATALMLRETNAHRDPLATRPMRMVQNYVLLLRSPAFIGYTLIVGLSFGALFSFISGSSFVLIDVLGIDAGDFGYAFALVVVGYISGAFSSAKLTGRLGLERTLRLGTGLAAVAGLTIGGLAVAGVSTLAAVLAPMVALFFACALVLPNATAAAINPFATKAGAVSALLGFLQMATGAVAGALVGHFHNGTTIPMGVVIAVCSVGCMAAYWLIVARLPADADDTEDAA